MATITPQQAFQRYKSLTPNLQDVYVSEQTAEVVGSLTEKNNLPNEKNPLVADAVGHVLLGLIHPEDLEKELEDIASVSPDVAKSLSHDFAIRLFDPIKNDLAKIYAPLLRDQEKEPIIPKVVPEVKLPISPKSTPASSVPPKPPTGPQIISQAYTATPNLGSLPLASNRNMAAPAPSPKPSAPPPSANSTSDTGWSRRAPQGPTVKLGAITPPVPMPAVAKAPQTSPAPKIIHEQSSLPTQTTSGFQLKTPVSDQMATTMPKPSAAPPARFEFNAPPKPPAAPSPVVHYSDYQAPAAPRQITEITAGLQAPMPPMPPKSPAFPIAPAPLPTPPNPQAPRPQIPQGNVIVKDFL